MAGLATVWQTEPLISVWWRAVFTSHHYTLPASIKRLEKRFTGKQFNYVCRREVTNASRVKSPLWHMEFWPGSGTRRVTGTIWMKRVKNNVLCRTRTRVGRLNGTGRTRVLQLRARLLRCWICYSGVEESTKTVNSECAFFAEQFKAPGQAPHSPAFRVYFSFGCGSGVDIHL